MNPADHGRRLRQTIEIASPALGSATDAFWNHASVAEMFPEFLFLVHASVRATVPLMETARRVALDRAASDPVAARLVGYYEQHAREEADHDEWLLRDIEALGFDRREVLQRVPPPSVALLSGAQYYWIHHAHPVALLGFFAVLEGYPPSEPHLEEVRLRTGLPADGFRMLIEHARLDPEHGDEVYALLDELPLTPEHLELVTLSALHTIDAVGSIFREIVESWRLGRIAIRPGA